MATYAALTVTGGTTITSLWGNGVRDNLTNFFANPADRATAIGSPYDGQRTYLTTAGRFESYKTGSTEWVPEPGTIVARANRGSSSSTTTTEIGVLRLDNIPIVNNVLYVVESAPMYILSASGDIVNIRFRYNTAGAATTASTQLGTGCQVITNAIQPVTAMLRTRYLAATTGTVSILLSVGRAAGTGNTQVFGESDFWITSLGIVDPGDTGTDI